jgi:3-hydroxymyristoyl/3-hydroxydecanoyl-(acyl carrier protein) dehydratase
MVQRILRGRPHRARSASAGGPGELGSLLRLLGLLWSEGVALNLDPLYGDRESGAVTEREPAGEPGRERANKRSIVIPTGREAFSLRGCLPTRSEAAPSSPSAPPSATAVGASAAARATTWPRRHAISNPAPSDKPSVAQGIANLAAASAEAHASFLQLSARMQQLAARQAAFQVEVARRVPISAIVSPQPPGEDVFETTRTASSTTGGSTALLNREACLEFARGSIARSLGPDFAAVDQHPTRVRLPDEPLMLVDRVLRIEGSPRSLGAGRIVTEHDILPDAWYLDRGRIPTCIAVEAGQADLMLSAYLGIDFETRGHAVYRLLDATVVFHDELPPSGKTIHYAIEIERFAYQDGVWLFWFHFDATVDGAPLMSMRDGCAGFFTHAQLAAGAGVVRGRLDERATEGRLPADWRPLVELTDGALNAEEVDAVRRGDLGAAFGHPFDRLPRSDQTLLPQGRMRLVDRVTHLEPRGGPYGIGRIRAEADIDPEAWFLTCHFVDDRVMPGTLMYECCLHTLRILLLRLGWVPPDAGVTYQPLRGTRSRLKCRGQVLEQTAVVAYDIALKELGYGPEPYAIADATMLADDKPIVEIGDMCLQLSGTTREALEALWARSEGPRSANSLELAPKPALYDRAKIEAFAHGSPSEAFGAPYLPFDRERTIARLPRPPFLFIDRITAVEGAPFELTAGATCEAEVAISARDWFFASNRQAHLPFSILLEIALQPCGWLAAYVGSALASETTLRFRNLGGEASMSAAVGPNDELLTTRAHLTRVSQSGGMIIQHFDFRTSGRRCGLLYEGTTYFGFFSDAALADQVGVPGAARFDAVTTAEDEPVRLPHTAPFPDDRLRMVDQIDLYLPQGGAHGLGFIRGSKRVDPAAWFFEAHFYQDPVWPGSLGLESFLQLLKWVACQHWPGSAPQFSTMPRDVRHRWTYRGQITPQSERVEVEATIKAVDAERRMLLADGLLSVDGRVIYQLEDFALALLPEVDR